MYLSIHIRYLSFYLLKFNHYPKDFKYTPIYKAFYNKRVISKIEVVLRFLSVGHPTIIFIDLSSILVGTISFPVSVVVLKHSKL